MNRKKPRFRFQEKSPPFSRQDAKAPKKQGIGPVSRDETLNGRADGIGSLLRIGAREAFDLPFWFTLTV
jgi:hypothetical protein